MLWRISSLDKYTFVSNSDSHSANVTRLGREFNALALDKLTYPNIWGAIKSKDPKKFIFTGEVPPALGKYHWDGHRLCNVVMSPKEALKHRNVCPVCRKQLTIGVEHRVEELADRPEGFVPPNAVPFKSMLPLSELLAGLYNIAPFSKKVFEMHSRLMKEFGNEFAVLLEVPEERLKAIVDEKIVNAIIRNRSGQIPVQPGYDGVYGKPIFEDVDMAEAAKAKSPQHSLTDFTR